MPKNCLSIGRFIMGLCFKIIEIWNLFEIWDFVYWNSWFIQVRNISLIIDSKYTETFIPLTMPASTSLFTEPGVKLLILPA